MADKKPATPDVRPHGYGKPGTPMPKCTTEYIVSWDDWTPDSKRPFRRSVQCWDYENACAVLQQADERGENNATIYARVVTEWVEVE